MNDPADIDGDGEFDAIDISIMEDDRDIRQLKDKNSGYCVAIFILGSVITAGWVSLVI